MSTLTNVCRSAWGEQRRSAAALLRRRLNAEANVVGEMGPPGAPTPTRRPRASRWRPGEGEQQAVLLPGVTGCETCLQRPLLRRPQDRHGGCRQGHVPDRGVGLRARPDPGSVLRADHDLPNPHERFRPVEDEIAVLGVLLAADPDAQRFAGSQTYEQQLGGRGEVSPGEGLDHDPLPG